MQVKELARRIKTKNPPCVVDVRSAFEYRSGHIPGAVHVPFLAVFFHLRRLPRDKETPLVLTCEHGPRAQLGRQLLGLAGYRSVELLAGHMAAWRRAGLPLER